MSGEINPHPICELEVLAGGDYVRDKLISTLTTGANDFTKLTYAIELRMMAHKKRSHEVKHRLAGKMHCDAWEPTDIFGLRLASIFDEELLNLVSNCPKELEFMQDPTVGLCAGTKLFEAVTEIVV